MTKERRLGRGLAALLGTPAEENLPEHAAQHHEAVAATEGGGHETDDSHSAASPPTSLHIARIDSDDEEPGAETTSFTDFELNVYDIDDNPFQPRRDFSETEIASLAESLKEHHLLQPVLVRRMGERYQLISGERRLRAAIQAGWTRIPARLRDADDRLVAELAIVENLQRKDLNPIEKALSFRRYLDQHQCPQEELAKRLKIDRATIANLMRLLELPQEVQTALAEGHVSAGHARALLPLGEEREQIDFCRRIRAEGLSVRDTEQQVREKIELLEAAEGGVAGKPRSKRKRTKNEQVAALERELRMALGTKTEIRPSSRGRGKIVIHYTSHDEFERLRTLISDNGGIDIQAHAG